MSVYIASAYRRFATIGLLALAIGLAVLFSGQASAGLQTFTVTKEADTADGSCDASDCSFREAVIAANQTSGATISVPAGTYKIELGGGGEDAGATGDFDITSNVTIIGAGPDQTFIDGNLLDRVIDVRDGGALNIFDLTIQHGKVGPGLVAGLRAGGPLVMNNVHVVENEGDGTDDDGTTGGVSVGAFTALITNSVISDNTVTGDSVGGLVGREDSDLTVRNTVIEGNSASGKFALGGASLLGKALLENVTIKDNHATGDQPIAGVFAGKLSDVTVRYSQINNNDAAGDTGVGGLFTRGLATIVDTTIDGNDSGDGGVGGFISLNNDDNTANVAMLRVRITNNTAKSNTAVGGAVLENPATLNDVTIQGNSALSDATGGLKFFDADPVQLNRVTIRDNTVTDDATAGLSMFGGSNVTVTDSWIDGNTAGDGAVAGVGISNAIGAFNRVAITNNAISGVGTGGLDVYQATASLLNVTITGNSAVGNATGGAYVEDGTLNLHFVTIDNNSSPGQFGVGGLTNYGTLTIDHSILGHNPADLNCYQTENTSGGFNLEAGTDCGFTEGTDLQSTDPMLGSLGFTGGSYTPTEPIGSNSPAKDAAGSCANTVDQRNSPRPMGSACDIGAFEFGNVPTTDRVWGDVFCDGSLPNAALALIAMGAGVNPSAAPTGSACPAMGASVYVDGWFTSIGWGDVDCNGLVTIIDALDILRGVVDFGNSADTLCPLVGETVAVGSAP